jgi:hypothetical protein
LYSRAEKHQRKALQKFSQERWLDMGMATLIFTIHINKEGRSIGDVLSYWSRPKCVQNSHNLGIPGKSFVRQNEKIVVEMTCKFLDYFKLARLEAAESENTNTNAESMEVEIQMTDDGYLIIPKVVMERDLRKAEWEKLLWAFLVQHYCEFCRDWKRIGDTTPSEIYDINQLEGMRIAKTTWNGVDASTICHCWIKAGILPDSAFHTKNPPPRIAVSSMLCNAEDPMQMAERSVEKSLDALEQTGVLQHANCLGLEDLLNLEPERQVVEDSTDEDIYHVVMAGHEAEENIILAGGANDNDNDAQILLHPSWKAALQATVTLERYISMLEEPYVKLCNLSHWFILVWMFVCVVWRPCQ